MSLAVDAVSLLCELQLHYVEPKGAEPTAAVDSETGRLTEERSSGGRMAPFASSSLVRPPIAALPAAATR